MKNNIGTFNNTKYFRAKDLAAYLSIGLSSVWKMSKDGLITPIKISSKVTLFSKEEIDQLISERRNKI